MKVTTVALGFEVGAGAAVAIPIRHMAVCGQTQESGKTTTLEALITRSHLRALTFITKRGEEAFSSARTIGPYFREQADWQFVASVLEASRGEKLKFERSWIIKASRGAKTLADVQHNVHNAMTTAKGLSESVYTVLDAYLDVVVPAIARVRWAARVDLAPGVNAMDLTALPSELQHLVIKSSIDWILERETDTVVVVPEAWKFVPQGRGTPVKLSAAAFIRQGAGLRNYLWLDSQDLGGIEKEILRSVPVWLLGVQREANEIKRTLSNIPATVAKPSAADLATLELGQFFACWGRHATKTYVQPAWMNAAQAEQVATGALAVDLAAKLSPLNPVYAKRKEATVTSEEAARLTRENEQLRADIDRMRVDNATLRDQLEKLMRRAKQLEEGRHGAGAHRHDSPAPAPGAESDDRAHARASRSTAGGAGATPTNGHVDEATYQAILARLKAEAPGVIRLLTTRPEIEVTITRKTLTLDEFSLKGRMARLLKEGFFREPKGPSSVRAALKRTGPDANTANIGRALAEFTRDGFVTDEGSGYREVAGMTVNIVEQ